MSKLASLVPGGCHTYSKGDRNFPSTAPAQIAFGKGGLCWDVDGRPWVDWGMGINNVLIGHAEDAIDDVAIAALRNGQAFTRPALLEERAAEAVLGLWPQADMIKFCKNGSDANNAAIRLARAITGRPHIAFDTTAPFFSTGDWFCSTRPNYAGTLDAERGFALEYRFNDVESVVRCFDTRPLACLVLELCRMERPTPAFLETIQRLCAERATLLVVDAVVTGYRYGLGEIFTRFDVDPDLFTLGKGIANGYSVAALCGKREYMIRGADDVFLLSTTNGAESSGLAAAIATAQFYREHNVPFTLNQVGREFIEMITAAAARTGAPVAVRTDYACRPHLVFDRLTTRTAFTEAMYGEGVLLPPHWCCPCYRRTADEMDRTRAAIERACEYVVQVAA